MRRRESFTYLTQQGFPRRDYFPVNAFTGASVKIDPNKDCHPTDNLATNCDTARDGRRHAKKALR
jgi:hypothetical protein